MHLLYCHQCFFVQLRFKLCCLARLLSEEIPQGVLSNATKPSGEFRFIAQVGLPQKTAQANLLAEVLSVVTAVYQTQ